MVEGPLSGHLAHPGPRRPIVVTPSVQSVGGAAVRSTVVMSLEAAKASYVAGWQPIDMLIGKVKPAAEETPSVAATLSRLLG